VTALKLDSSPTGTIRSLSDATVKAMTEARDRVPQWPAMSVEERTRQYSPSSMLDGPLDPYLDAYATRSAEARAAAPSVVTVRYGPKPSNTIDVALPEPGGPAPALHVYIHGGYWQQLSKRESFFLAPPCLARGEAFAAIDYTLAPEATLDEIVDECCTALVTLRVIADTGELPIDPERITVSGSSAGAHLTALTACRLPVEQRPAAVILASGIYDLEPLLATDINDAVGLDVAGAQRNSPARCDLSGFPPAVIAFGDNEPEEFKRQSRRFADLIRAARGGAEIDPVAEIEVAGRNHFDVVFDIVPDLTDLIPPSTRRGD
jgi:arylformamidase